MKQEKSFKRFCMPQKACKDRKGKLCVFDGYCPHQLIDGML